MAMQKFLCSVDPLSGPLRRRGVLASLLEDCPPAALPPPWNLVAADPQFRRTPAAPEAVVLRLLQEFSPDLLLRKGVVRRDADGKLHLAGPLAGPGQPFLAVNDSRFPERVRELCFASGNLVSNTSRLLQGTFDAANTAALRKTEGHLIVTSRVVDAAILRSSGLAAVSIGESWGSLPELEYFLQQLCDVEREPWAEARIWAECSETSDADGAVVDAQPNGPARRDASGEGAAETSAPETPPSAAGTEPSTATVTPAPPEPYRIPQWMQESIAESERQAQLHSQARRARVRELDRRFPGVAVLRQRLSACGLGVRNGVEIVVPPVTLVLAGWDVQAVSTEIPPCALALLRQLQAWARARHWLMEEFLVWTPAAAELETIQASLVAGDADGLCESLHRSLCKSAKTPFSYPSRETVAEPTLLDALDELMTNPGRGDGRQYAVAVRRELIEPLARLIAENHDPLWEVRLKHVQLLSRTFADLVARVLGEVRDGQAAGGRNSWTADVQLLFKMHRDLAAEFRELQEWGTAGPRRRRSRAARPPRVGR